MVDDGTRGQGGDGAGAAVVRYTGLVGAIDAYLEGVMSWDKAEAARRLDVANPSDGDGSSTIGDNEGARLKSTPGAVGGSYEEEQQQQQLPVRSAKKTVRVGVDSPNTVARAARGWDNDAPVVAPGMRHYPQRNCNVAALVGNGGFDGRAGAGAALEAGGEGSKVKIA